MDYYTLGKFEGVFHVAPVHCVPNENCREMHTEGRAFLLLILTGGTAVFQFGEQEINAVAPCFVAFSEEYQPVLLRKRKLHARAIYFHPTFLNVNMTFPFIRDSHFHDLASTHDLFLMRPFLDHRFMIPIIDDYLPRILHAFNEMHTQLSEQPDGYWSCRARAGFMDIVMVLESHYRLMLTGKLTTEGDWIREIQCPFVRKAMYYIECHYMEKIAFGDILSSTGTNHTTLTKNFKAETGRTVMDYLQYYRVKMAEKQLRFTDVPLKDIASQCGFATTEHFSRLFVRELGIPPAAFRKLVVEKRQHELNPVTGYPARR